jgi:hypothetical protein
MSIGRVALGANLGHGEVNGFYAATFGGSGTPLADPNSIGGTSGVFSTAGSDYATANTAINAAVTAFNAWASNTLTSLFQNVSGGTVAYNSTTLQFSGAPASTSATWTAAQQIANIALWNTMGTAILAAAADMVTAAADTYTLKGAAADSTAAALAVTDVKLIATTATDGLSAIFTSTASYTAGTMQYSGTPATSATVTQTVQEALITIINTGGNKLALAQTAINADAATMATLANAIAGTGTVYDVVISVNTANITTSGSLRTTLYRLIRAFTGIQGP